MAKIKKSSPPATVKDVKEIVTRAIATDVKEVINQVISTMDEMFQKQNVEIAEIKKDMSGLKSFENEQREANEHIAGELKAIREEQAVQALHNMRANDAFENHETRISKLETKTSLAF